MHSGFLILLWVVAVTTLQFLPLPALAAALAVAALAVRRFALSRGLRLLRRIRFLLLAIVVFFAGFTPGEALWVAIPGASPTREGILLAIEHAARLVAVVLCVAILLERLSPNRLVGGLYALLRPFERVGLPADRLAVRLMLVLRYVEAAPPGAWRLWLEVGEPPAGAEPPITISRELMGRREVVLLVMLLAGASAWVGVLA